MQVLSICLTDIPKDRIIKPSNGKSYINIVVDTRREADKFGNTLSVYISQTKEEREQKVNKTYIGSGKEYKFSSHQESTQTSNQPIDNADDLPF